MLRYLERFAVISLGLGVAACTSLPDVEPGICGNHVIDPDEDCDGTIAVPHVAALTCGLPGTATACRYDCTADSSACPTGYFCGGDGICRESSGQFTLLSSLPLANGHLSMGDFNGDGLSDMVSIDYDSGEVGVYFLQPDGVVSGTFTSASDGVFPSAGWLDTTKTVPSSDLILALEGGLDVQRGQPDDSFESTNYAAFDVPGWDNAYLMATDVIPGPAIIVPTNGTPPDMTGWNWIGDQLLALHWDPTKPLMDGSVYCAEALPTPPLTFYDDPMLPLPVTGPWPAHVPLGTFDELATRSPCQQFVLPDAHLPRVVVVSPCAVDVMGTTVWNNTGQSSLVLTYTPPVLTSAGAIVSSPTGLLLAQLNPLSPGGPTVDHDDHLDLLIQANVGGQPQVFAAYGNGDGTFRSSPGGLPDDLAMPLAGLTQLPLATADFNADGEVDLVTTAGIYVSSPAGYTLAALPLIAGQAWSEAIVVDFNGDGLPDVVAGSADELGVDFFTNTPSATGTGSGLFNSDLVATDAPATNFVTGDFDGDLNVDIAFREGQVGGAAGLSVMFGQRDELPVSPQSLGQLDGVDQVVAGVNLAKHIPPTGVSDLLAVTLSNGSGANTRASVFPGRSDCTLQAPYFIGVSPTAPLVAGVSATATGLFHAKSAADSPVPHPDVAALITGLQAVGAATTPQLYLLQPQPNGAAQFTAALPGPSVLPTAEWDSAVLSAIDVDGDGEDEIALLAPIATKSGLPPTTSALLVQKVTATGFETVYSGQVPVGLFERHPSTATATTTVVERRNERLCVADVNGDALLDSVALTTTPLGVGQVTIFWGTGDEAAPFLNVADPYVITLPEEAKAFTCIDIDGKGGMDLVIVGAANAYVAYGATAGARVLTADVLASVQLSSAGLSVTTGNVDGDNLADLIISNASSATVYLGKALIK